ncbi:MAG: hypothetical protein M3077_00555 [Candidatus Dormibacteraeota bacterium]|nr:hypothetical protein [Candidatus Dormibacteraeota bacterium]
MPAPPWKAILIGSEVTVLAAFTGVGLHLAVQPHRPGLVPPPPLLLPSSGSLLPKIDRPLPALPAARPTPAMPAATDLTAGWLKRLGREDRRLVATQWNIVEKVIAGVERYLREHVAELEGKR